MEQDSAKGSDRHKSCQSSQAYYDTWRPAVVQISGNFPDVVLGRQALAMLDQVAQAWRHCGHKSRADFGQLAIEVADLADRMVDRKDIERRMAEVEGQLEGHSELRQAPS
jgi:hypothetical protein